MLDDELARFHAGDEGTFRRLVDELSPRLLAIARPFASDVDAAHDLVQETWVRAFRKRESYLGRGPILGWLCSICRNVCLSEARRSSGREIRDLAARAAGAAAIGRGAPDDRGKEHAGDGGGARLRRRDREGDTSPCASESDGAAPAVGLEAGRGRRKAAGRRTERKRALMRLRESCLDDDLLVSVGEALEWEPGERVRHLARCDSCGERLDEIVRVRATLARTLSPEAGFAERVLSALEATAGEERDAKATPQPAMGRAGPSAWLCLVSPTLAATAVFFSLFFTASATVRPGSALAVSALAGLAALVWNATRRETSTA